LAAALTAAIPATVSGASSPGRDTAPLGYFAGRWNCNVHFLDGRPDRRSTRTAAFSSFLAKRFLVQRYESPRPKQGSVFRSVAYDSYSTARHRFEETDFDSAGGTGTGTSGGWHADAWYWTYGTSAHPAGITVIRRLSERELLERDYSVSTSGDKRLFVTLRCRKTGT
jgi:hypothetical protein